MAIIEQSGTAIDDDAVLHSYIFINAGTPTDGSTFADVAPTGALLIDTTNGVLHINTNTKASPTWTIVGTQA